MSETSPDAVIAQALRRFKLAGEAEKDQRKREKEDLEFQIPELQWSEDVRATRDAQTVNGVPIAQRPMLSIPKLDQPIQLVLNQERSAQLGVQVHPLDEHADDDTAEVLQGLYRRIEVDSRANLARSWGFERAVKAGRGVYRVLKEYDPAGGHPSDQRLVIKRVLHQGSVYLDPFAQEPDWSDGEWAFVVEDMPLAKFKRLYPDAAISSYDHEDLVSLGSEHEGWIGGTDEESRTIRVAEYFTVEYQKKALTWQGADGQTQSRDDEIRTVTWRKINAVEVLETGDWEGQYIPIIPVIGRELIPFDGKRRWVGIIGPNKGAQRLFNYAASGAVEAAALEPKAPFDVDPDEIAGFESFWQQANARNFPYLPRHKFVGGREFGPVQRLQADMSKVQMNALLLSQAADFLHAGTGAFEPSLGQQTPNVRTKGATLALQQQHDQGNSNWLDNLAEISLTHEARVVLDLIPHIYDRPGRVARVLDLEDNPSIVMLNQPFTMGPQSKQPMPVQPGQPPPPAANGQPAEVQHYDLSKGRYGVTVSVGRSYKSRVEQGADELGQLFQAEPQLFSILGDLYLKFRDFPGHFEAAERVKKMLPPQLQGDGQDGAAAQVPQLQAQVQQLTAELQKAGQMIQTEQVKHQAQVQIGQMKSAADVAIARMGNATKILVARITAAKEASAASQEDAEEALALAQTQAFDADQAHADRAHELGLAAMQHGQALQAGQQDAAAQSAQSAQDHGQALEQGDAATQGQIAVQAAAPQPGEGDGNA